MSSVLWMSSALCAHVSASQHHVLKDGAGPEDHITLWMVPSSPHQGRRKRSAESQPKDAANNTRDRHTRTSSAPGRGSCTVVAFITAVVVFALTPGHQGGEEYCWPSSDGNQRPALAVQQRRRAEGRKLSVPHKGDTILSPAWKSWLGPPIPHQQHSCAPHKV